MAEKITTIHESVEDKGAQDFFLEFGHVALANVYDPTLGDEAASYAFRRSRLRVNDRISGQTGEVRYSHGLGDPLSKVIHSAIESVEMLGNPTVSIAADRVRAQVIDHGPGAEGMWHRDLGIIVTTLQGSSHLEIQGEDENPDVAYELVPGRIVVMNPKHRLLHRGVASPTSTRTGLAIERMR